MHINSIRQQSLILFSAALSLLIACNEGGNGSHAHDASAGNRNTSKKSIPSETKERIGSAEIKINYHAPAVRGRVIWGGLVPYDSVWVTGAHRATTIKCDRDFRIGDRWIPAGKYALFTIPGREAWTVIINKNWDQHLADDYSREQDVNRLVVKPEAEEEVEERLKYEIVPGDGNTGEIIISWEKLRVPFAIETR